MTLICFILFIVMGNSYYVLYSLCISPYTSLPISWCTKYETSHGINKRKVSWGRNSSPTIA
ncbi:hypothetical protein BDV36DRAFT_274236 [Aspergillus pseudocaelatus]|uniref:Uncharacterized protein n=1 Tax=Aspergillus pseudocaelatus TaxID=1825620 RepID=A0ABQ6W4P4_9EURO|nr:hypothetical protein BDV36DRAFT_274236 [Aspergillus pseudocaelatus]